MNPRSQSVNHPIPDPFAEIERRRVADWQSLLLAEPELLEESDAQPGTPPQKLIRCWDEIADLFTLAAPATQWIVEGILPRASVTLLAGEPGSYKTWLALALLRGVAGGGSFLGRKCAQTGVLYLDRENPLAVMRERLAVLGIESLECSRIWGGWLGDAPPAIGDARLIEIARERRPLIIFDSLIRFHAAADENSATEMASVMGELRSLANAGATVVALHHKPKSEGAHYRGSSDIAGGVDTAWAISRDRGPKGAPGSTASRAWGGDLLRLECFKNRYAEEFSLTLRPDLSGIGDFALTDSPQADSDQGDIERLCDAVRRNPGQLTKTVIAASGLSQRRGRALLERFEGRYWHSKPGSRNARLYFTSADPATDPIRP